MLTILACWFDEGVVPFVEPLLHRIATDLNGRPVRVVFVGDGPAAYRQAVLSQFAKYTPCFSWVCCAMSRPHQSEVTLGSLIPEGDVLCLPASAVPVGDALKTLDKPFDGVCLAPGAWVAYSADAMRSNITPAMAADCPHAVTAPVFFRPRGSFHVDPKGQYARPFVAYPPPLHGGWVTLATAVTHFGESA